MLVYQRRMMEVLNKGDHQDATSRACDIFLSALILLNLAAVCLESVESINREYNSALVAFEWFSVSIFLTEYLLRIWSIAADNRNPAKTPLGRRARYIFSFTGLIDLAAILPSILPLIMGGVDLRWLRVLRLVRLLKISHYSSALEDLFSAVYEERRSFAAALYLMAIALFLSSSMMYLAEYEVQPEHFRSIPQTMWWSLITLTTVGYGDVFPITPMGKVIGAFTALMGVCTVALLTGIVASAFSNQMARREAIFEAEINAAMSDGIVTLDEKEHIEELRERFNIPEEHATAIFALLAEGKKHK
ncbi:ion transporter [bacterium]|nr:ion transporter [Porticoccaceae bacterium]MDB4077475.1 ion transporter [Porticoccaceae bacterium]MDB9814728.1 ion transporter [bacterium]MDB9999544.1 ion transporter [Porticoccaceae bacterium]MDC0003729.1 ion transporter [Porticoccaceae bacterium]